MGLKVLVAVLAVIILVLLGVFFFYKPAQGPTIAAPSSASANPTSTVASTTLPAGQ